MTISAAGNIIGIYGLVAQLGEHTVRIRKVEGSIPFKSTKQVKGEPISFRRWIRLYRLFLSIHTSNAIDGFPPVAL